MNIIHIMNYIHNANLIMSTADRKEREFKRRETEILETAVELFQLGEIHTVTMEQMANKAQIAVGTFYKHFQSKDEICIRVIIELNNKLNREIQQQDTSLPFKEYLEKIIDLIWEYNMRNANILKSLYRYSLNSEFLDKVTHATKQDYALMHAQNERFYLQLLNQAALDGKLIGEPIDELYFCTSAAIDGAILTMWDREAQGGLTPEQQSKYLSQLKKYLYRALIKN